MNSKNLVIAIVVILVLGALGWYLMNNQSTNTKTPQPSGGPTLSPQNSEDKQTSTSSSDTANEIVVTIDSAGFSPKEVKVKNGDTVVFKNTDSEMRNVSSAIHPTHQVYPPLNLGNIEAGSQKSLMFPDPGTYKYHDHLTPTRFGTIVVE